MIDFRSDTVTKPTLEMRQAMFEAEVGDDVYGDDPTINQLEALAAKMTGKEAAVFVSSGTMGNQLSIYAHTKRGDEIICGSHSHIKNYEVGASAVISGVSYHLIEEDNGLMPIADIKKGIRGVDIHYPDTGLICLENAHGSGRVYPLDYMKQVYELGKEHNLKIHLDGARLFNAATYLKVDAKTITQYVDSVTFCLSKGLAAPVGSIVCGSKEFCSRVRRGRKLLGGGMRQVGILGAAGLVALNTMTKRLQEDHDNALYLAEKIQSIPGLFVVEDRLDINMVFVGGIQDASALQKYLKKQGILIGGYKDDLVRFALHNDIKRNDIDTLIQNMEEYLQEV